MISLGKITHQILCHYPFSQKIKKTKRAVVLEGDGNEPERGLERISKRGRGWGGSAIKLGAF